MNKLTPQYFIRDSKNEETILLAASVILLRDVVDGLEVLLLRRSSKFTFQGAWVFPGGQIDAEDYVKGAENDLIVAACRAAVREAKEEAGIFISPEKLILMSCWTTPEVMPRRFKTWFFVAPAGNSAVQIDGDEIHDHCWTRPDLALAAHRAGKIKLFPPTFISLLKLSAYRKVDNVLLDLANSSPMIFTPRNQKVPGGSCSLYEDDAGYLDADLERPGKRHRLWMLESGWRYERSE